MLKCALCLVNFFITFMGIAMKKQLLLSLITTALFTYSFADETITVDATKFPNGEILEITKPILKKQGYDLKINDYNSYNSPTIARFLSNPSVPSQRNPNWDLSHGKVDANFFQHKPYLDEYNTIFDTSLVSVGNIFYVPTALYCTADKTSLYNKTNSISQTLSHAKIIIPDNAFSETRAIKFLSQSNLLTYKASNMTPGLDDVESNPYKLSVYKVDASIIIQMLNDNLADCAVLNIGTVALSDIKIDKPLFIEKNPDKYANILVARSDNKDSKKIQALKSALQSKEVKDFINKKYPHLVYPAF